MSPFIGLIFVFHGVVRARNNRALVAKKPFSNMYVCLIAILTNYNPYRLPQCYDRNCQKQPQRAQ